MAYDDLPEKVLDQPEDDTSAGPSAPSLEDQIAALYQQYYGRPPQPWELTTHTTGIRKGYGTLAQIEAELNRTRTTPASPAPATPPNTPDAPAPRTAPAPSGVDAGKWASGHVSPKYAFMEASQRFDQKTPEGRQQTLAELQTKYPQWFTGWTIDGDKLRFTGDPKSLHPDFDGFNEFDAWVGSKAGQWQAAWQPTQQGGQAFVEPAQPAGGTSAPMSAPNASSAPSAGPSMGAVDGADWFAVNLPPAEMFTAPERPEDLQEAYVAPQWTEEFDAPDRPASIQGEYVAPQFTETFQTPERPEAIRDPYEAPVWTDEFRAPSEADLYADPGYKARLEASQRGFERSAAAKGSILSGGTQVALGRELQNVASNEYGKAFGRAYDTYQQRYGQFQDKASRDLQARGVNEQAYQTDVGNARSAYDTRLGAFTTNAALGRDARTLNEDVYQRDFANAKNLYDTRFGAFQTNAALGANARQLREASYLDDVNTARSQYDTRYRAYRDAVGDQFRLADYGLNATLGGRP